MFGINRFRQNIYVLPRGQLVIASKFLIRQTIFVVDRVDLDQQTTSPLPSYAEHDVILKCDETDT